MKRNALLIACLILSLGVFAQQPFYRFSFSAGGHIQHYNGNLGNSLFRFKTVCFSGVTTNLGIYLNPALELDLGNTIGHYGYCPTPDDLKRTVPEDMQCPGEACQLFAGMGNLRSQIVSSNLNLRFKFANGFILPETARIAPCLYAGVGLNHLSDVMRKNCVNPGLHFTINGGTGLQFNFTPRWSLAYNLDMACFMTKKVYLTNADAHDEEITSTDPEIIRMQKRHDLGMRNSLLIGFRF